MERHIVRPSAAANHPEAMAVPVFLSRFSLRTGKITGNFEKMSRSGAGNTPPEREKSCGNATASMGCGKTSRISLYISLTIEIF
jgi:hypothetical protein